MVNSKELLKENLIDISNLDENLPDKELYTKIENKAIDILNITGHDRNNLYAGLNYEVPQKVGREFGYRTIQYTVVAAKDAASPAHIALTVDLNFDFSLDDRASGELEGINARHLLAYDATSKANYTVLLTLSHIAILGTDYPPKAYSLANLGDEIDEIYDELEAPDEYPVGKGAKFPAGHHPHQTKLTRWLFPDSRITPEYRSEINTKEFNLDIDKYSELLYNSYTAKASNKKGNSLENVVEYLFNGLSMINIKDRNLRTRSDEIDFVLEYVGYDELNLFDFYSRYILIECKNINESVSSKEVGHFSEKLRNTGTKLGVLVAWNGISGSESGKYAQRYIDLPSSNEPHIIVIDSDDLYEIMDGKSLYQLIDERIYKLKFDLEY